MQILFATLSAVGGLLAFAGWVVVAVSAARLAIQHPAPGRTALSYPFQGYLFFSEENCREAEKRNVERTERGGLVPLSPDGRHFAPSGAPVARQLRIGAGVFALGALLSIGGAVGAAVSGG